MIETLFSLLASFIIFLISSLGYLGVAIAMAIESASIPLPSEIIMPFSGYLVSTGRFNFWLVTLAASIGGTLGSSLAYAVGYYGGEGFVRTLIRRYGRYVLVHEYELDESEEWFRRYGQLITFFSRLLPVVRTFISLPAGIAKMHFPTFVFYAFVGTFLWCSALAYVGMLLGENWNTLGPLFHKLDVFIALAGLLGGGWYIRYKLKKIHSYNHGHHMRKKNR